MTLIAEFHDPRGGSVFLCDCLVTYRGREERKKSALPLHVNASRGIETRGSAVASKFLTGPFGFIAAAGRVDHILNVANSFLRTEYSDLGKFQSELDYYYSVNEKAESYIYSIRVPGDFLTSDSYCRRFSTGHLAATCGGSGAEFFQDLFGNLKPDPSQGSIALSAQALGLIMQREFSEENFPDHNFGGAYELLITQDGSIERIPYAILDIEAASELAADGIYDVHDHKLRRIIICAPFDGGSHFIVFSSRDGTLRASVTTATEPIKKAPPVVDNIHEVGAILRGLSLRFNVVLYCHSVVNYVVWDNLISWEISENGIHIEINQQELWRASRTWNQQG